MFFNFPFNIDIHKKFETTKYILYKNTDKIIRFKDCFKPSLTKIQYKNIIKVFNINIRDQPMEVNIWQTLDAWHKNNMTL